jgi:predicted transcriptional regulator
MEGLDGLLAKLLQLTIHETLGNETIQKIEERLLEKGYSLTQALQDFDPFDKILREFFGKEADEILLKIFNSIFDIRKDKYERPKSFLIKDKNFINLILSTYSSEEKRTILSVVSEYALSVSDILKKINLPQSTGYRIISSLIKDGLLVETDKSKNNTEGRKVSLYKPTISSLDIQIRKSLVEIEIPFTYELIKNSHIITGVMFLFGRPDKIKKFVRN